MLKIRWSWDRLIFNMAIPILVRRHLYIETAHSSGSGVLWSQCTRACVKRKSQTRGRRPRHWIYCLCMPQYILTTKHSKLVLNMIMTWHYWFQPININVLLSKSENVAEIERLYHGYVIGKVSVNSSSLYKTINCKLKSSICLSSHNNSMQCIFLKKQIVFSQTISSKVN